MPSPRYYRRQAELCLRLSHSADGSIAMQLLAMALEYLKKAEGCEQERQGQQYIAVIQDAARQKGQRTRRDNP